jgi:hypothetical protein
MKTLIALAGLALATPAFAQSPVKAAVCCPCGGGCTCAVGVCPGGCPDALSPVNAAPPACYQDAAGNWICPLTGKPVSAPVRVSAPAPVSGSCGAAGGSFFLDGPRHPLRNAVAAVGEWIGSHRPHVFGGRRGCR